MKLHLVDDWRKALSWVSVQCMLVASAIHGAWVFVPDDMKNSIPPNIVSRVTIALLGMVVFGRIVKQHPPACPDEAEK